MRPGVPISIVGHIVAVAAGIVALPYAMKSSAEVLPVIPIELLELGEETNIRAAVEAEEPEPEPEPEPAQEEEQPEPPPAQAEAEPAPPPPPAPEPEPIAAPEPVPEPEPEPEPEPQRAETPPTMPRPPTPEPPAEEEFDLADIRNLVDRAREDAPRQRAAAGEAPPEQAERARESAGLGSQLTISEIDALRARINQCWRSSADAPNPEELYVRVRVRLNRDGSLAAQPQLLDELRLRTSSNPYLRLAADRAIRAVNQCAPYEFLPEDRYSVWREFTLNFDSIIH